MKPGNNPNTAEARLKQKIDKTRTLTNISRAIGVGLLFGSAYSIGSAIDGAMIHSDKVAEVAREAGSGAGELIVGATSLIISIDTNRRRTILEAVQSQHDLRQQ